MYEAMFRMMFRMMSRMIALGRVNQVDCQDFTENRRWTE
jgi:hypothetical protein